MTKLDLFAPFRDRYAAEEAEQGGPKHWRSLDHKARTEASRDLVEQEFPHDSAHPPVWSLEEAAADPSFGMQRRDVLKLMGASMALAGLGTACVRRPEEEILPYTRAPEDVIPGVPSYYATAVPGADGAVGVLVESHEGRPTKIEGNPDHPGSRGRADIWTQSRILEMYDPDRSQKPLEMPSKTALSWADWDGKIFPEIEKAHAAKGGAGLAFLTDGAGGPTFDRLRADVKKRFPQAAFYHYDALASDNTVLGTEMVFGAGTRVHHDLSKAKVVLALDSNFLVEGPDHLQLAAGFAKGRDFDTISSSKDAGKMNRLYAVEGVFSVTGSNADHRLRVATSEVPGFAKALAKELLGKHGLTLPGAFGDASALGGLGTSFKASNDKFIPALAKDLAANKGRAVILVGERQPAAVHALAHLLNAALGAFDSTSGVAKVTSAFPSAAHIATPIPTSGEAAPAAVAEGAAVTEGAAPVAPAMPAAQAYESGVSSLTKLVSALEKGQVETLVILGANPVYAAPGSLGVKAALGKAKKVVHLGLYADETAHAAHVHLPQAHFLEAWDDAASWDGTFTVCQPLIEPLFQGRSAIELLAQFAGEKGAKGKALVEQTWRTVHHLSEKDWRKLLHDGATKSAHRKVVDLSASAALSSAVSRVATAAAAVKDETPSAQAIEVVFTTSPTLADGRFANLGWNQELPDPMTKLCWDNALVVSPKLARTLGINSQVEKNAYQADEITLTVDGASVTLPTFVLPGLAENTATVHLGYGRTHAGFIGNNVGIDVFPVLPKDGRRFAVGAKVEKTGKRVILAGTQDHFSVEGIPLKETSIQHMEKLGLGDRPLYREGAASEYAKNPGFAKKGDITSLGIHPETKVSTLVESDSLENGKKKNAAAPTVGIQLHNIDPHKQPWTYDGQAWGMTIDLTTCTGCNACAIACQAENNIPVVGRDQVLVGREMHWIRIDRYFTGDVDEPKAVHQAVPCMQCENAPCEPVCPVAATVHDEEGLNSMVYNRCIGTRYCANNCPYKVRRFNFLDFTHSAHLYVEPPHDERKRLLKMVRNPDVTVRFRGVMEKCTYCTQRIQEAKFAAKRKGEDHRNLPDGAVTPACAQTCPSNAISFGNINGKTKDGGPSEVARRKASDRNYEMLSELNVRPRTTYLAKLRNTNPELA